MTNTLKPLSKLAGDASADTQSFKVAALEMLERAYRQAAETKQPAVMVQAVRTAAEIGGVLKGEPQVSAPVTVVISGDDKALL